MEDKEVSKTGISTLKMRTCTLTKTVENLDQNSHLPITLAKKQNDSIVSLCSVLILCRQ